MICPTDPWPRVYVKPPAATFAGKTKDQAMRFGVMMQLSQRARREAAQRAALGGYAMSDEEREARQSTSSLFTPPKLSASTRLRLFYRSPPIGGTYFPQLSLELSENVRV